MGWMAITLEYVVVYVAVGFSDSPLLDYNVMLGTACYRKDYCIPALNSQSGIQYGYIQFLPLYIYEWMGRGGGNQPVVTDGPVEFDFQVASWSSRLRKIYPLSLKNQWDIPWN